MKNLKEIQKTLEENFKTSNFFSYVGKSEVFENETKLSKTLKSVE